MGTANWQKGEILMIDSFLLGLFLYFPEDKTEYIPAAFTFAIFFIAAIFTFRLIVKISKKEAKQAKELEDKLKQNSMKKDS